MSKNKIDHLIPIAIDCIKSRLVNGEFKREEGKIPKEYNGYASNFGAGLRQSGLLATIAFFEAENSNSKQDRSLFTKLILDVIYKNENYKGEKYNKLLDYTLNKYDDDKKDKVKRQIVDAAIALKLAMRVFKFSEDEKQEES